ncbi:MAG: MFS transporter [Pseudomonadota bacterium]
MSIKLSGQERYAALSLSSIYAFRMLGLFMILPVFTIYARQLYGSTSMLIGVALGIYGLTQACLQIPFGMLSDAFGRKRIIFMGLLFFAGGSIIAALSHSISGIIIGRALQGAGAVGSTLTALLADLTREENRTKAMALVGSIIALSFCAAMILGPAMNAWVGVPGIFWLTAILAACGIVMLVFVVPTPARSSFHSDTELKLSCLGSILKNGALLRQDLGIFMLHAILTASFIAVPVTLTEIAGLSEMELCLIFVPVIILAFVAMIPMVVIAESKRKMKQVYFIAVLIITLSQLFLWEFHRYVWPSAVLLFLFFTAFITLEATIPSLVSKIAPAGRKGTALGIYSTCQFLGIFVGGSLGGFFFHRYNVEGVFLFSMFLGFIWLLFAFTMKEPRYISSHNMRIGKMHKADAQRLQNQLARMPGVVEVAVIHEEGAAYLKIDKSIVKTEDLQAMTIAIHH